MLIRFYRSNQPATLLSIPFLVALLWIPAWRMSMLPQPGLDMPVFKLLLKGLSVLPTPALPIIGILLVSGLAILLNYLTNEFEVLYKKSHLPSLFFALLVSALPGNMMLHPALFAAVVMVFVLGRVYSLYKNDASLPITFEVGFLIAMASLIYFPSIVFLLLLFISLVILRPFVWREWVSPLIGVALPYAFLALYYFWFDRLEQFNLVFENQMVPLNGFLERFQLSTPSILFLSFIGVFSFFSILKVGSNFFRNVIRTRNYQQVLLSMLVVSFLPLVLFGNAGLELLFFIAIPLSVFLGYYFLAAKRLWLMELVFIVLLGAFIFSYLSFKS